MNAARFALMVTALAVMAAGCDASPSGSDDTTSGTSSEAPVALEPGESVTIDALDGDGRWGQITVRRGDDVGGYSLQAIDPETFVIEIFVEYRVGRAPAGEFGTGDWALATADDRRPAGEPFEPPMPPNPEDWELERQPIGTWPGAVEVSNETIEGLIAFLVPRELADRSLELIYRPVAGRGTVTGIVVRAPGAAPEPVAEATAVPAPAALTYVEVAGAPFTLIQSPAADALFVDAATCTNRAAGYTVSVPAGWHTNAESAAGMPECSLFGPSAFEVGPGGDVPSEVAIVIQVFPGALGSFTQPEFGLDEPVLVAGFEGHRRERIGVTYESGAHEALPPSYEYWAILADGPAEGPTMIASTASEGAADYELNKAVLDRIMASLALDD